MPRGTIVTAKIMALVVNDQFRQSVVFLPPRHWVVALESECSRAKEKNDVFNQLVALGVSVDVQPPLGRQILFFKRLNPFLLGLDPLRALKVMLFRRNVSVIVSVCESSALFILLLRKIFFFRPKVLLWDVSVGNSWWLVRGIQKLVLHRYDGFLTLAQSQTEYLQCRFPIKPIRRIGYNVDEEFFSTQGGETRYCLAVGDDISRDYGLLLKACNDGLPVELRIRSSWVPAAQDFVPPSVSFSRTRCSPIEYRDLLDGARLIILPLKNVPHPGGITSMFEAMAMSKPILISRCSLSMEYLTDGVDCVMYEEGDWEDLRSKILELLDSPETCTRLGANARRTLESNWTTRHLAKRLFDTFCG